MHPLRQTHPSDFSSPDVGLPLANLALDAVAAAARGRTPRERAALFWFAHRAEVLPALHEDFRRAMIDPDADLSGFAARVESARVAYESALPTLALTQVRRTVAEGIRYAAAAPGRAVEIVGKTRLGKTVCARNEYQRLTCRARWLDCPSDDGEPSFLFALARALGIQGLHENAGRPSSPLRQSRPSRAEGVGGKVTRVRARIRDCFGPGGIELLIVDEGHFLFPADPAAKPRRLEFLRELIDGAGASAAVLATPQFSESLNAMLEGANPRWVPGQWEGRVVRFHLEEAMSERDLAAVARHHAPEADARMVEFLVLGAMATEGYCGSMVNTIELARFKSGSGGKLTLPLLTTAAQQMTRRTALGKLVESRRRRKRAAPR
jgi:hypothetical protein